MNKKRLLELAGIPSVEDWTDPHRARSQFIDAAAKWLITIVVDHYEDLKHEGRTEKINLETFVKAMVDSSFVDAWIAQLDVDIIKRVNEITPKAVKELRRGRIGQKRQRQ